jgi:hypothetical protein
MWLYVCFLTFIGYRQITQHYSFWATDAGGYIYLENNQKIQYIKHGKYRQDSETSIILLFSMPNICFQQIDVPFILISHEDHPFL